MHARWLMDPSTMINLGDGSRAGMAVDVDGEILPWIMVAGVSPRATIECPSHERLGPLPAATLARVWRCEAATGSAGRRCRRRAVLGGLCGQHARLAARPHDGRKMGTP